MLESIKNFFISFADIVTSVVDFFIGFVEDIVFIVKLLGSFVAKIPRLFSWLPTECVAILTVLFGVVVIYKVMGREG